jgi:hypothetical protein
MHAAIIAAITCRYGEKFQSLDVRSSDSDRRQEEWIPVDGTNPYQ